MLHRNFFVLCLIYVTTTCGFVSAGEAVINTAAGTGGEENNGDAGAARAMNIGLPFGVEIGPDGALYITECLHHRVRRLDRKTGELTTVAGNGQKGWSGDGGPANAARLDEPYEVRFDKTGNMYFVEMQNHIVRRVDAKTGRISTIAGTGRAGFGGDGGPATEARFKVPHSITLDDDGFLYVADIGNHRIRRIDLDAGTIETIAGTGEVRFPADGAKAKGSPLPGPRALAIGGRTLWIVLREGHSVWKCDLDEKTLHHVAGTGKAGYSGDGGPAIKATFKGPKGLALGPTGNLFVVDSENEVIRRIDLATHVVSTVAGSGRTRSYGGDGGDPLKAKFSQPHGICLADDGTIYIGDTRNHRVRAVSR